MSKLTPDRIFGSYSEITPDYLLSKKIRFVLCDIDNTLVTYDDVEPTEGVLAWIYSMRDAGIEIIFVSNNNEQRVKSFAEKTGCRAYANSGKPLVRKVIKAMRDSGAQSSDTAVIGDQIFTDILLGAKLKLPLRLLVPPIKDKKTLFFRFKRFLEKPVIKKYLKAQTKSIKK